MKVSLALGLAAATTALAAPHAAPRYDEKNEIQFTEHQWKEGFNHVVDHSQRRGRLASQKMPKITGPSSEPSINSKYTGNATFTQPIDHKDPSKGTFEQLYYYSTEFWQGPGSPVVLFTPGEENATQYQSYLTTNTTPGVIAEKVGGAVILLEHRYWGYSSPFADQSTENLQYLTLENNIADLTNFAQKVELPFAKNGSNAADAPWVMSGGSYSGALAAWTESTAPGIYWAYHASSAPVQAVSDYWSYFKPIIENMPRNCSNDLSQVIAYMDVILANGNDTQIKDLKTQFGLQDLESNADFMAALQLGPELWQDNQLFTGYSEFFMMCDTIEGVYTQGAAAPNPDGVGVAAALNNFAAWFKLVFLPDYCSKTGPNYPEWQGKGNTKCLDMQDPNNPFYADHTVNNVGDRQWVWMTCNEPFGYWQGGNPDASKPTLVSRLVNPKYFTDQCSLYFPTGANGETYGLNSGKTEDDTNKYTKGWSERASQRLVYGNGGSDPWRECGVSSSLRPGGPLKSTSDVPVHVIDGGFHTSDMLTNSGTANEGAKKVIDAIVGQMVKWIGEYSKKSRRSFQA